MEIITADLNDYLRIYLRTYPPPVSFLPRSTAIFEEQLVVNNVIFFRAFSFPFIFFFISNSNSFHSFKHDNNEATIVEIIS